jgi:uncharacterized membrane protein YkoI
MKLFTYTLAAGLALSGFAAAQENEKPVQFKDLPAAVQKAVPAQTRGAKVKVYNKEVEGGKTFYEAETTVAGKSRDILFDESGAVVEVEQGMDLAAIPAAAKTGIEKAAAGGKVLSVESVTKGTSVVYEAVVSNQGKKHELQVNADGSPAKE